MNQLMSPMLQDLFQDPGIAADGKTYDRAAISHWFQVGRPEGVSSPMTNLLLDHTELKPNHEMRAKVSRWQKEHQAAQQQRSPLVGASHMTSMQREPSEIPSACGVSTPAPLRRSPTLMDSNMSPLQSGLTGQASTVDSRFSPMQSTLYSPGVAPFESGLSPLASGPHGQASSLQEARFSPMQSASYCQGNAPRAFESSPGPLVCGPHGQASSLHDSRFSPMQSASYSPRVAPFESSLSTLQSDPHDQRSTFLEPSLSPLGNGPNGRGSPLYAC